MAGECADERARPCPRRSPRAFRLLAGARTDSARFITGAPVATFRYAAPKRYAEVADERRAVAGDDGGRLRTRNVHRHPNVVR
jgi:hypothetical protein